MTEAWRSNERPLRAQQQDQAADLSTETIHVTDRIQAAALGMVVTERLSDLDGGYGPAREDKRTQDQWMLLLMHEIGEVAWQIVRFRLPSTPHTEFWRRGLVRIAATAVAALEADIGRKNRGG